MVSPAFATILRSRRDEFNARFAAARPIYPELNASAFTTFLETTVDPLVLAVAESDRNDRLNDVAAAAFDAALELVGQKLAGPGARMLSLEEGWRRVLPKAAKLAAAAPGRLIPAVCNALHQLASTPGARPDQWIESMERLGPDCADVDAFLRLGQVAAWRAGLAHFRAGAIAAADALPEVLAIAAIGAQSNSSWPAIRKQLEGNRWFDPAAKVKDLQPPQVMLRVGAFRGFGGLFAEPPIVAVAGEDFLVRTGTECWLLVADVFGATFHHALASEFNAVPKNPRLQLEMARVVLDGQRYAFPGLESLASAAANATTLALTSELSHSITLVRLK